MSSATTPREDSPALKAALAQIDAFPWGECLRSDPGKLRRWSDEARESYGLQAAPNKPCVSCLGVGWTGDISGSFRRACPDCNGRGQTLFHAAGRRAG